ncbi:MAG: DMT family transporter [Chitinophagaceae bacterium]
MATNLSSNERAKGLTAVAIVSILWGTTWMASKVGIKYLPALQLSGLRHVIGGGLYVIYFAVFKKMFLRKDQFLRIFMMAIIMFVLSNGLSVLSVAYMPSGIASVVGAIAPIWVVIIGYFFQKNTKLLAQTIIGIVLGFAGVIIGFYDYMSEIKEGSFALGIFYGLISSITWAIGALLTAKQAKDTDPYFSLGWQMLFSGILLNLISFATGDFVEIDHLPKEAWLSIAYLVIIGSVIAFGAYVFALKRLPAALVTVHAYINPIVALIIGSLLLDEQLTKNIAIGTIATLLGVFLVNNSFRKTTN